MPDYVAALELCLIYGITNKSFWLKFYLYLKMILVFQSYLIVRLHIVLQNREADGHYNSLKLTKKGNYYNYNISLNILLKQIFIGLGFQFILSENIM